MNIGDAEEWRPVVGHFGAYEVSDRGRVRSLDRTVVHRTGFRQRRRGQVRKSVRQKNGYFSVLLPDRRRYVHILVLEAFVGPCPPGHETLHHDGDPSNNDLTNLRYGTPSENAYDKIRHGRHVPLNRVQCPRRHPLDSPNLTPWALRDGRRSCLACERGRHAVQHAHRHGEVLDLQQESDKHYRAILAGVQLPRLRRARGLKLSDAEVAIIRERYSAGGVTQRALAEEYGTSQAHVSDLLRLKRRTSA